MAMHDTLEKLYAIRDKENSSIVRFVLSSDAATKKSELDDLRYLGSRGEIIVREMAIGYWLCVLVERA